METKNKYPRALVIRFWDWEALYIDGKLAAEALRLGIADLIDAACQTDIMVRDVRYMYAIKSMEETLRLRTFCGTYSLPNLTDFGEENLNHVRL